MVVKSHSNIKPFLNIIRNIINLSLALLLLFYFIKCGYELDLCLGALRIYSGLVIVLELLWRIVNGVPPPHDTNIYSGTKGKHKKQSKVAEISLVFLWSIASILLTHIITVLFGAYLVENFEETFTFSLLVASLAFIRPLINLGPSALLILLERLKWESECEGRSMCVLFGAWLGAAPIPLDWDTPWQVWPLTCSIGAILSEIGASVFFLIRDFTSKSHSTTKLK